MSLKLLVEPKNGAAKLRNNDLISLICYYVHTVSLDFIKQYNPGHAQKLGPNGGCNKKMKKEPETSLKIFPLNQSRGLF